MWRGCFCASYLEGESVLAGAEPHVLHGGAVDHHLSHISAGHKHWSAETKRVCSWAKWKGKEQCFPPSTKFVFFLPSSHHSVHKVGAVWRHCKAADSRCGVHEVAVSKYSVMRCCISSKGEHTHCERVAGGVLWWNSMHLVPPKRTQTFHFRWAKRVLFIHLRCIFCGVLLEEGFMQKTSS